MDFIIYILVDYLLFFAWWALVMFLWALALPIGIVLALPVVLIRSAIHKTSVRQMLLGFIRWLTDLLPALPNFKKYH